MKIDILTLFPEFFNKFTTSSIIAKAIEKELVSINIHDIRNFSTMKNKQVDDYPYGGGSGMVLMCEPIFRAINSLKQEDTKVIMMSPSGYPYHQKKAYEFSKLKHIIILCGHYEGFDERITTIVDYQLSIGDYVLTGGEIPAMVVTDSIVRLVDGVIKQESHLNESFNNNLLDYPNYTKPRVYNDLEVPEVLLSGHHENINNYRYNAQLEKTKNIRPDLIKENSNEW